MTEQRRSSFTSLRAMETPASRLTSELTKLKVRPETIILSGIDAPSIEALANALRISSSLMAFPEPLVLVDARADKLLMINNAAVERIADIRGKGLAHPALSGWKQAAQELDLGRNAALSEFQSLGKTYERKVSMHEGTLQVHFREKKEGPQIFYPFPVIDFTIALGFVSFRNEAARKAFPSLDGHAILSGIREAAPMLRNGTLRGISDTVVSEGRVYKRAAVYIAQSDIIRVFVSDVTECSSPSRAALLGLCMKIERCNASGWTQPDLLSLDRMVREFLQAVKKEKGDLGTLEREVLRLSYLTSRFTDGVPPAHELESLKSVLSEFVRGLPG